MAKPIEVTKKNPCEHCGKPDWCYRLESLSVCNRDGEPATGWYRTSKTDKNGQYYYAPINQKKSPRPAQKRVWEYRDRNGNCDFHHKMTKKDKICLKNKLVIPVFFSQMTIILSERDF